MMGIHLTRWNINCLNSESAGSGPLCIQTKDQVTLATNYIWPIIKTIAKKTRKANTNRPHSSQTKTKILTWSASSYKREIK